MRDQPDSFAAAPSTFGLAEFRRVLEARRPLILATTLAFTLAAALYVLLAPSRYTAGAEIVLDPRKNSVAESSAVLSSLPADQTTVLNQVEVLGSYRFAGKVVDALRLNADPEFANRGIVATLLSGPGEPRDVAINTLLKRLKVSQVGFSSTIRIEIASPDRAKAVRIADAFAALYVAEQLDTKAKASAVAGEWLGGRIKELSRQVQEAEAAVQKFKADHNITLTADGVSVTEQQIADLNSQLTIARADHADKAAKAARLAELARQGRTANAPQAVTSVLIASLRTQEAELNRQLADLATRYGPNHPKMVDIRAQKADLEAKIELETLRIADAARNDADASAMHVGSLQASLRGTEQDNARQKQAAVELTALQSAATSTRAMYEAFLARFSQTENQQGILAPDAHIVSNAEAVESFGPQAKLLAICGAVPAGFLLGLVLALIAERGGAPRPPGQARGVRLLAKLPPASGRPADLIVLDPTGAYARAVHGVLASLRGARVVAVTSARPGEGKTTLALALARTAATSGLKTIVIDANLYDPHLHRLLGKAGTPWHGGQPRIEHYLGQDPASGALALAADPLLPGYESLLTEPALTGAVAGFRRDFDLIVVAALPLPYGEPFCRAADAVLLAGDCGTSVSRPV